MPGWFRPTELRVVNTACRRENPPALCVRRLQLTAKSVAWLRGIIAGKWAVKERGYDICQQTICGVRSSRTRRRVAPGHYQRSGSPVAGAPEEVGAVRLYADTDLSDDIARCPAVGEFAGTHTRLSPTEAAGRQGLGPSAPAQRENRARVLPQGVAATQRPRGNHRMALLPPPTSSTFWRRC